MKEHICEVCGRANYRKLPADGKNVCEKHYKQFRKYGRFLDNNPRTLLDRNEYHVYGKTTKIDLYDKDCNVIAHTLIDTEDLDKVKYTKWKLTGSGYAANTPKYKGSNQHLSRVILGTDQFVDHINHNTLDNRKKNLRIVTKSQNQMNCNYKGVCNHGEKYFAYIKINQKMLNLGTYVFEEEALFARWYAETILFGEYRYPKPKPKILKHREKEIMEYVDKKVQRL